MRPRTHFSAEICRSTCFSHYRRPWKLRNMTFLRLTVAVDLLFEVYFMLIYEKDWV
jgi:hypothetical protein